MMCAADSIPTTRTQSLNLQLVFPSMMLYRTLPLPSLPYPNAAIGANFGSKQELSRIPETLREMEKLSNSVSCEPFMTQVLESEVHKSATKVCFPSRNRYGRPYISGRPLLTCDRKKIVELFDSGMKKIHIARQLGITHSCVSKVLRRYQDTGLVEARVCRTASCSCPGSADRHDERFCRHLLEANSTRKLLFSIENILLECPFPVVYSSLI